MRVLLKGKSKSSKEPEDCYSSEGSENRDEEREGWTSTEEIPEELRPPKEYRTPGWANLLGIDDAELIERTEHFNLMGHPREPLPPEDELRRKEINGRPFLPRELRRKWAAEMRPRLIERAQDIGASDDLRNRLEQIREKLRVIEEVNERGRRTENTARRHQSKDRLQEVRWVREYLVRVRELYILKQAVFQKAAIRIEAGQPFPQEPQTENTSFEDLSVGEAGKYGKQQSVQERRYDLHQTLLDKHGKIPDRVSEDKKEELAQRYDSVDTGTIHNDLTKLRKEFDDAPHENP